MTTVRLALTCFLSALLQLVPTFAQAQHGEFKRAIDLGELIYIEEEGVYQHLLTFFPDVKHRPADPLPDRLIGEDYFHIFMMGADHTTGLRCIRIGRDTQEAMIRELGHPLRGHFMDHTTTEMKDVGQHDVIMDCYLNFPEDAFSVPLAIDYFARQDYVMDIRRTPEQMGGSPEDNGPYQVLFDTADNSGIAPSIIRGRLETNGGALMVWFRFVSREKIIG